MPLSPHKPQVGWGEPKPEVEVKEPEKVEVEAAGWFGEETAKPELPPTEVIADITESGEYQDVDVEESADTTEEAIPEDTEEEAPRVDVIPEPVSVKDVFSGTFDEMVNVVHPSYYGYNANPQFEAINVIEDYQMNFCVGNAYKYVVRAGLKNPDTVIEDLEKAMWYLKREYDSSFNEYRKIVVPEPKINPFDVIDALSLDFFRGTVIHSILEYACMGNVTFLQDSMNALEHLIKKEKEHAKLHVG